MSPNFKQGNTLRSGFNGRVLEQDGKKVKHHKDCEANMCDGWPLCRYRDGNGGAILITARNKQV